jgi:uncharacterized membrane protein
VTEDITSRAVLTPTSEIPTTPPVELPADLEAKGYKPFYSGEVVGTGFWLANPEGSGVGIEILDESTNEWKAAKLTEKIDFKVGFDIPST